MQAIMISELSMRKPQTLIQRIFLAVAPKVSIQYINNNCCYLYPGALYSYS
jgi:hypothetical protein